MKKFKWVVGLAAAMAALAAPASASAGVTISPGTTTDPEPIADCSLRAAVLSVNQNMPFFGCPAAPPSYGDDTIVLAANTTYPLTKGGAPEANALNGDLDIASALLFGKLTITSPGGAVIDASGLPAAMRDRVLDIQDDGDLTLSGVSIRGGISQVGDLHGGGIRNLGKLAMSNGDLSGSLADNGSGGGLYSDGDGSVLTNVTVSGNDADNYGGGLHDDEGLLAVFSTTITDNSAGINGGGIRALSGSIQLTNSILSGNTDADNSAPDCESGGDSLGTTILGIQTGCSWSPGAGDPVIGSNPQLDLLLNNGGGTLTHALLAGSAAINAGAGCPATDQRGLFRSPVAPCDIGAFEVGATATLPIPPGTNPPQTLPGVVTPKKKCKKKKKGKKADAAKKKKRCKKKKKKK